MSSKPVRLYNETLSQHLPSPNHLFTDIKSDTQRLSLSRATVFPLDSINRKNSYRHRFIRSQEAAHNVMPMHMLPHRHDPSSHTLCICAHACSASLHPCILSHRAYSHSKQHTHTHTHITQTERHTKDFIKTHICMLVYQNTNL